ncbi:DUF4003 family protein [Clostridium pascui]|uniref:DUF4003 family protein n=1 Tax=Clostridium pascui TaxID=46609 RepID=UPI00195E0312
MYEWDYKIRRTREFFDNMKKNHFLLTSADDYVFVAVLAVTHLEAKETSKRLKSARSI